MNRLGDLLSSDKEVHLPCYYRLVDLPVVERLIDLQCFDKLTDLSGYYRPFDLSHDYGLVYLHYGLVDLFGLGEKIDLGGCYAVLIDLHILPGRIDCCMGYTFCSSLSLIDIFDLDGLTDLKDLRAMIGLTCMR